MSIAALTDREIDALVAERIFGIRNHNLRNHKGDTSAHIGHFSTNIGSAFLVVERMREKGWEVVICASRGKWDVTFGRDQDDAQAYGDTAPRAICLAALSAMNGGDA